MATQKRTARQKKLDRLRTSIARFGLDETYTDEKQAQEHLINAMNELRAAADKLIESES